MRLHPQEYSVTYHVLSICPLDICILFLPILGLSKSLPNLCQLLLHVLDQLWSNGHPVLNPIPTQRCPTRSTNQGLVWQHTNGGMMPITVGKLGKMQVFLPLSLVIHYIHWQHILENLIKPSLSTHMAEDDKKC